MNNSKSSIMGSEVSLRKERSETPSVSTTASKPKKKKNIRQIYIKSVNQNRSVKGGSIRSRNITNLDESNLSKGSSHYLTNEYNLVKKILNATKALERLKTNTDQSSKAEIMSRSSAPKYKTQEEYYEEILELKKSLKMHENNELITKAKMEYFENELARKEQEILNLLDVKKNEELRSSDAKTDLDIINLKLKAYKLEFSLKRKDAELKKLKDDLKTTNIKELKNQNERLRVELSKALMNDKRILEAQEIKGIKLIDGKPVYEFFNAPVKEPTKDSPSKTEVAKQNIAKRLQQSEAYDEEDDNEFVSKYRDVKDKIVLKGTLKEKLEQLDKRETELLQEISRLNQKIEELKEEKRSGRSSHRSMSGGSDRSHRSLNEKAQANAIKTLQSVLKGHLERTKSLEFETKAKAISVSHSPSPPLTPPFSPLPINKPAKRDKNDSRHHHNEPHHNRERIQHDEDEQRPRRHLKYSPPSSARSAGGAGRPPRHSPPPQPRQKERINRNRQIVSESEDDDEIKVNNKNNDENQNENKKLIEKKENAVDTDSFGCCSPWRTNATSKRFF